MADAAQPGVAAMLQAALAHHQAGRRAEAESLYRQVLASDPRQPDALHLLGVLAHEGGRPDAAVELIGQALQVRPAFPLAWLSLGNALRARGQPAQAAEAYARSLDLDPGFAQAHCNLGLLHADHGQLPEALACLERAVALHPDLQEAHNNLGMVLEALGQPERAIAHLQRALALRPDDATAHSNLGNALLATGDMSGAVASYQRALALRPGLAEAWNNLGQAREAQGLVDEAIAAYRQAQAARPDLAEARFNEALALLSRGDYAAGWPLYESRFQAMRGRRLVRDYPQPRWRGDVALSGRRILLHYEQGFGDTLQALRYVPVLAGLGAQVVVEVPPALVPVATTLPGGATVVKEGEPLPAFDLQCPLMSLPLALRTTLETIPAEVPYLRAPDATRAAWRARLGERRRRRIGIAWSGSAGHTSAMRQRRLRFADLMPLLALDADFFSLQKEYPEGDRERLSADGRVRDCSALLADFGETAGLLEQLDLVISVDTAVAHLAGAMGRPLWLLLPYVADWRWLRERSDSPWYPTARLFRQADFGDWGVVIDDVVQQLGDIP